MEGYLIESFADFINEQKITSGDEYRVQENKNIPTRRDEFDIRVGDTIGNSVNGFNFEVLKIKDSGLHSLKVKDKRSGKIFNTTKENMYLSSSDFKKKG